MTLRAVMQGVRDGSRELVLGTLGGALGLLPVDLRLRLRERGLVIAPLDYPTGGLRIAAESWIEYRVRRFSCAKEPDTVRWIEGFRPGDVLYDIGANVGAYSLVAFAAHRGAVPVMAFEPSMSAFPQLVRNLSLNSALASVRAFPVALSDTTGVATFHYQNMTAGGALHALGAPVDQNGVSFHPVASVPVLAYCLDQFAQQFALPPPSHIKIDVDGPELTILRGARGLLRAPSLRSLLIELGGAHRDRDAIVGELLDAGLVLESDAHENWLFVRKDA